MPLLKIICLFFRALLVPKMALAAENLALRQQVAIIGQALRNCQGLQWLP